MEKKRRKRADRQTRKEGKNTPPPYNPPPTTPLRPNEKASIRYLLDEEKNEHQKLAR